VSLSAEAFDGDGAQISGVPFVWTSSDDGIATVDDAGNVTALANGVVSIFATNRDKAGSALVEVGQVAASVVVDPSRAILEANGAVAQFNAIVSDGNGHTIAGAEVVWTSSDESVATVDALSGEVAAVSNGTATITATSDDATGTAQVDVDIPQLATITVTPGVVALAAFNETTGLSIEARDQHRNEMVGVSVTWSSSDPGVASVDENGEVTALSNGSATITATSVDIEGSAVVTVEQEVASITVTPSTASMASLNEPADFNAIAWDAGGSEVVDAVFEWRSSSDGIVAIVSPGSVVSVSNGTANVLATVGDVAGSAAVTVSQEAASVAVTPSSASMSSLGDSVDFEAAAWDALGNPIENVEFSWISSANDIATVGSAGWVTAASNGVATISANIGTVSATADVTVDQEVASASITPAEANLGSLGESADLIATAWDAGGSEIAGVPFTWMSSEQGIATVGATGRVSAVSNGSSTVTATVVGSTISASADIVVSQEVASVTVTPPAADLGSLGDMVELTATAFDAAGAEVENADFTWASSDASVADVDSDGAVVAAMNGGTTITATVGGLEGSAEVTVSQRVALVEVVPNSASFVSLGDSESFVATASDARGNLVAGAEFRWGSSADGIASVDVAGAVVAVSNGPATITATAGEVSGSAEVVVDQQVASVDVTPPTANLASLGEPVNFEAKAWDAGGSEVTDAAFAWASSLETVASVGPGGTAVAESDGSATITATADGASGSAEVTVEQVVASVTVTPSTNILESLGESTDLVGAALDARGNEVPTAVISWESSNEAIATVGSTGTVTAVANGTTTITASSAGFSSSASVDVQQVVASVQVTPPELILESLGATEQLTATVRDALDNIITGASVVWAPATGSVATVDGNGEVTAVGNGAVTVTATSEGVSGGASVGVQQVAASVQVAPTEVSFASLGASEQLTATVLDGLENVIVGASVVWAPATGAVATVDGTGEVTAVGNGAVTVTATSGGASGGASVEVQQVVASVEVAPAEVSLASLGETAQLTATVLDALHNPIAGASVDWAPSAGSVATVDGSGEVTAIGDGTETVTATSGGFSGSASVEVQQVPASVEVNPATMWFGALGETEILTATVRDALGSPIEDATVLWDIGGVAGVVTVDSETGLVTAVGNGETSVVGTSGGAIGSASATVQQVAASVEVTPDSVHFDAIGETEALAATVRDVLGNVIEDAPVSWSVEGATGVAQIGSGSGIVEALGNGNVSAVATSGGVSGATPVVVEQVAASVEVTPSEVTLTTVGETSQLSATVLDANGNSIVGAAVTWAACPAPAPPAGGDGPQPSTGLPCPVEVDENGMVTALFEGTATVTATHESLTGEATVTVSLSLSSTAIRNDAGLKGEIAVRAEEL